MEIDWNTITVRLATLAGFHVRPQGTIVPENWFRSSLVDFDLWLVHGGEELLIDQHGVTHTLRRGSAAIFKPDEIWSTRPLPSGQLSSRHSYVHFDLINRNTGKRISKHQLGVIPSVVVCHDMEIIESMLSRIVLLSRSFPSIPRFQEHPDYKLACSLMHALLQLILLPTSRPPETPLPSSPVIHIKKDQCLKVLQRLQSDPRAFTCVSEMASSVNLSAGHFSRFFRKVTGLSPQQAINSARIERAKLLLAHSGFSLGKIADECGYQSTYYFCRQFKNLVGVPPGRFRRNRQH